MVTQFFLNRLAEDSELANLELEKNYIQVNF